MDKKTIENLRSWAIATNPSIKPKGELTVAQQIALKIYKILSDGKFWKAGDLAAKLGKSPKYIGAIIGAIKEPWGFTSNTSRINGGYKR
jgi:hypothetical protein